jgi:predicted N-acetyltransferase YhbS
VTLSAAQIERAFLPKRQQRGRPNPVPVTLVGQLAVDKNYQGQGHAASLLMFALKTALRASEIVGSLGVITHPLDEGMRRFYSRWGFQDLPFAAPWWCAWPICARVLGLTRGTGCVDLNNGAAKRTRTSTGCPTSTSS